jgi:2-polyprenyl-6-hydroxyphenyl methylase/3-demethylubiquinone-9 3-methyltransferase
MSHGALGPRQYREPLASNPLDTEQAHYPEWEFSGAAENHHYLVPAVLRALPAGDVRVLDLGCGNGALTARIRQAGKRVSGIDFTPSGIERARRENPGVTFHVHDLNEPLPDSMRGQFDAVVSAEVIEHLFLPRTLFARCREALGDHGHAIITTPFHGYWKNLAIVLSGQSDRHWAPLTDYGHIKFFSKKTLQQIARECGFEPLRVVGAGRIPLLAATMVMTAQLIP